METLILASNSPRRNKLLSLFGWPFSVIPADIDERQLPGEPPVAYVRRMAFQKAQAIASLKEGLVVAADTIVVDGGISLGKPVDAADAHKILRQLRNRTHQVFTGINIIQTKTGKVFDDVYRTDVPMRAYSDAEIAAYIATGDPMDKAGAYGIQHAGFHPAAGLSGCYASVMGLPICHLARGLGTFNVPVPGDIFKRCESFLGYNCCAIEKFTVST